MHSRPTYSVVLPIHNQSSQLPLIVERYSAKLDELGEPWELLLVVNGSRDDSYAHGMKLAGGDCRIRVFELEDGGWGRAVKFGLKHATGEFICYTNSARTSINDLGIILRYALTNPNIVIKTTRVVRETVIRKVGSILYNYENRQLLGTPLWDVNGTPKVIPARFLESIEIVSDGDLLDAELMARIYRNNIQIVEILILTDQRIGGRSTTSLMSALRMYRGLFTLRRTLANGGG